LRRSSFCGASRNRRPLRLFLDRFFARKEHPVSELPIVCTLQPGEFAARASGLLPGIARLADSRVPIAGGYRFEFASSIDCLSAIAAMIDAERRCCRFMRFQLTVEPDSGPVRLDVTGSAGTQEFLSALVASE
jgi:hypothetical protein